MGRRAEGRPGLSAAEMLALLVWMVGCAVGVVFRRTWRWLDGL